MIGQKPYWTKYLFHGLAPGESCVFVVTGDRVAKAAMRTKFRDVANKHAKRHPEQEYTVNRDADGNMRCWRIK